MCVYVCMCVCACVVIPVKYKGILKIIYGIYTRCQQIDFLKQGKFECQKDTR